MSAATCPAGSPCPSRLRDAGLRIADLRRFTELLRTESGDQDRVAFLRRRRADLVEQQRAIAAALAVLDDKIAYYGGAAAGG